MSENALIIFVKNPRIGQVKTRIARTVGDEKALEIYRTLLTLTRETVTAYISEADTKAYVFYDSFIDKNDEWQNSIFAKTVQFASDNLGERMQKAFDVLFVQGYKKVVIIGSDCPYITKDILHEAFTDLKKNKYTLGGTYDGGYYLLGIATENYQRLFEGIAWSTPSVYPATVQILEAYGQPYTLLETLHDIDEAADWQFFLEKNTRID